MIEARVCAWVLVLALAACGRSTPVAPAAPSAAAQKASVELATTAFHDALRNNDMEKFMAYVADDVVFMPAGEPPVRGKEAMRQWMTAFVAQYRTTSLTLANREVRVAAGWAVELGTYEWGLAPAAGGPTTVDRGNYMQVWQQRGDRSWSFAREVYNSSLPPASAPQ